MFRRLLLTCFCRHLMLLYFLSIIFRLRSLLACVNDLCICIFEKDGSATVNFYLLVSSTMYIWLLLLHHWYASVASYHSTCSIQDHGTIRSSVFSFYMYSFWSSKQHEYFVSCINMYLLMNRRSGVFLDVNMQNTVIKSDVKMTFFIGVIRRFV